MRKFTEETIQKIPPVFRNVFFLAGLAFVLWMIFLDDNNFMNQYRLWRELNEMEEKMEYYKAESQKAEHEYQQIIGNPDYLEKVAREKYWMKKDNEDLYIVVEQ